MKNFIGVLGGALLTLTFLTNASAVSIDTGFRADNYIGAENNGFPYDVIGSTAGFGVNSSRLEVEDFFLQVTIDTNFVQDQDLYGAEFGDLFLGNSYTPDLSGDSGLPGDWYGINDNLFSGTQFEYAVRLTGNVTSGASGGVELWQLDTANYADAVLESDVFFGTSANHRNGQEVRVDTSTDDAAVNTQLGLSGGGWTRDLGANTLTIRIETAMGFLINNKDTLAWHWGMTCGNDTVEDSIDIPGGSVAPVPEPGSLLVFSSFAIGLVGVRRRRRQSSKG